MTDSTVEDSTVTTTSDSAKYPIPDKVYSALKWVGLFVLPAISVCVSSIGIAWGWPHVGAIAVTFSAVGTAIGASIGVSQIASKS